MAGCCVDNNDIIIVKIPNDIAEYLMRQFEGRVDLERLMRALQSPPTATYLRVNTPMSGAGGSQGAVRDKVQKFVDKQTEEKGWPSISVRKHPLLSDVLWMPSVSGEAATAVGDSIYSSTEVIVDVYCAASILRGADIFVPGLLGASMGMIPGCRVSVWADIDGRATRGSTSTRPLGNRRKFLGHGIATVSRDQVFKEPPVLTSGICVSMTEPIYRTLSLSNDLDLVFAQNLPSILMGRLLNPQPGERILDMCAAPGGKTTHLAMLMQDQGTILAFDRSAERVKRIQTLSNRFNLKSIIAQQADSSKLCRPGYKHYQPDGSFDRILLDPPCSGLGQRPIFRWPDNVKTASDLDQFASYQKRLFRTAFQLLKPNGGRLVYSTCTINPAENERIVEWALEEFAGTLCLIDCRRELMGGGKDIITEPESLRQGLGSFGIPASNRSGSSKSAPDRQPAYDERLMLRFDPYQSEDTIGFFGACFEKNVCATTATASMPSATGPAVKQQTATVEFKQQQQ